MTFGLDTSVVVALLCTWHDAHEWAILEAERRMKTGGTLVLAGHTLLESYSVLTRLPAPHRLAPDVAFELLKTNFYSAVPLTPLNAREYWALCGQCAEDSISGGRANDALIAFACRKAKVDEFLTLNPRDFESSWGQIFAIVSP